MFLGFALALVPADDGLVVALHDGLGGVVGPLGGEDEDLRGLLHVLLVQVGLLLGQHVGGQRLGHRHGRHGPTHGAGAAGTHTQASAPAPAHVAAEECICNGKQLGFNYKRFTLNDLTAYNYMLDTNVQNVCNKLIGSQFNNLESQQDVMLTNDIDPDLNLRGYKFKYVFECFIYTSFII